MTPKQFLQIGGVVLVLLGVIGFLKPDFGIVFFSPAENWAHLLLGIVALVLAPLPLGDLKKWVVVLVGLVALVFAVLGYMAKDNAVPNFYGVAQLDNPVDNVLHLVVGIWALLAAFGKKSMA
jgi:hypothetical protein